MPTAADAKTLQRYGRVLVLLGIRNELRARRVPAWRQERNRIEIDRALAELAQHPSRSRDGCVPIASIHSSHERAQARA
jgi:hypothetical protein